MSTPELSIILPAIRQERWNNLYDSIALACKKYTFELIICGPLPLTPKLQTLSNVKYVKDLGSPMRASNIAAMLCEGKLVTWIADDALLAEDSLDKNIDLLYSMGTDEQNCVMIKYSEGKHGTAKDVLPDSYFFINNSGNGSPYLNNNWVLFNHVLMYRSFFDQLGGWDCSFEACPMGHNDMAIRAQFLGAKVIISPHAVLDCDHMEGGTGDHMPIYKCQTFSDEPKYRMRYRNPNWIEQPMKIRMDNWKKAPIIWKRRFQNGVPQDYETIIKENLTNA